MIITAIVIIMQVMTLSMVQVLLYDAEVPMSARIAMRRACCTTSPAVREAWLELAATHLVREAQLDRADALALVGLDDETEEPPASFDDLGPASRSEDVAQSRYL